MKRLVLCTAVVAVLITVQRTEASAIVDVSIPDNSQNDVCHPWVDDVWGVSAPPYPLNVNSGIGYIINPDDSFVPPMVAEDFSMHEHDFGGQSRIMIADHTPDPARAVVTYTFDSPTIVDQLEIIQHTNGISQVEGFVGDSVDSLTSIGPGPVFGPYDDVTGPYSFTETQSYVFDFNNGLAPGKVFQFVIRKISHPTGYAAYRAYPRNADGVRYAAATAAVPEPASLIVWSLLGAIGIGAGWRRRGKETGNGRR